MIGRILSSMAMFVFTSSVAVGQGGTSPLLPPGANFRGKSFDEWNILLLDRYIEGQLGEGVEAGDEMVGNGRLLPLSSFENLTIDEDGLFVWTDEYEITMKPGTGLVGQPYNVWGETYDDPSVPDDTPELLEELGLVDDVLVRVTYNGRNLIEGTGAQLKAYQFGSTYFEEPIEYAEPQPRGEDLNATAALFGAGVGAVFRPLPVGTHTLEFWNRSAFFNSVFRITYRITVSPK